MATPTIYFDIPKELNILDSDLDVLADENVVKESVKNLIGITRGSLIYKKRKTGIDLTKYLFDQIDIPTAHSILKEIERGIAEFEPRAKNTVVEIIPHEDENTYEVNVRFTVDESDRDIEVSTTLEKIRWHITNTK